MIKFLEQLSKEEMYFNIKKSVEDKPIGKTLLSYGKLKHSFQYGSKTKLSNHRLYSQSTESPNQNNHSKKDIESRKDGVKF